MRSYGDPRARKASSSANRSRRGLAPSSNPVTDGSHRLLDVLARLVFALDHVIKSDPVVALNVEAEGLEPGEVGGLVVAAILMP